MIQPKYAQFCETRVVTRHLMLSINHLLCCVVVVQTAQNEATAIFSRILAEDGVRADEQNSHWSFFFDRQAR